MRRDNLAEVLSVGGIFTALAVILQASPVILPGIGLIISPLSTLPVAVSAMYSALSGILTLTSGGILLLLISSQEALIFVLTTAPLGLALGLSTRLNYVFSWIISSMILFGRILTLINVAGIAALGAITDVAPFYIRFIGIFVFSFIYTGLWILLIKRISAIKSIKYYIDRK